MEIELLKKENTPENVIEHSLAVYKKAMKIAANFENADNDLIRKGALLHDRGRSKTHGITHALEGVKIAEGYGYDKDVLNIIERHIGAGITENRSADGEYFSGEIFSGRKPFSLNHCYPPKIIAGTRPGKEVNV